MPSSRVEMGNPSLIAQAIQDSSGDFLIYGNEQFHLSLVGISVTQQMMLNR